MNLLITKDEEDNKLGSFFNKCADYAVSLFNEESNIKVLTSQKLKNNIVFNMTISNSDFSPFNFFAFTHGEEDGLIVDAQHYVGCDTDDNCWKDANIVYNFSCLSACQFGKNICEHGAKCFVGHNKEIIIQTLPKFQDYFYLPLEVFLSCLSGKKSVQDSLNLAKEKYTDEIDVLYNSDMLHASLLLENRDSLVCYGDSSILI
ncbi:MAG: hypothetical protein J5798_05585 [Spirochaetaceae bacterium]|nr:hypothetical protein [Spirochaetaceae bacterium]